MLSAAPKCSSFRPLIAVALTVLFCAGSALMIVGWLPGTSGLPLDIAAISL